MTSAGDWDLNPMSNRRSRRVGTLGARLVLRQGLEFGMRGSGSSGIRQNSLVAEGILANPTARTLKHDATLG